jgi:hypothetical protein
VIFYDTRNPVEPRSQPGIVTRIKYFRRLAGNHCDRLPVGQPCCHVPSINDFRNVNAHRCKSVSSGDRVSFGAAAERRAARNFRIEMGTSFASHDINGVPDFEDRRQLAWQGVSVDCRYRFLDRDTAPMGLTAAAETHADRIDETTAAVVRNYGTALTLAFDRELVPDFAITALNLIYQPGRSARSMPALDLVDFERRQARQLFGVNF